MEAVTTARPTSRLGVVVAAAPDVVLGLLLAAAWLAPEWFGQMIGTRVTVPALILLVEVEAVALAFSVAFAMAPMRDRAGDFPNASLPLLPAVWFFIALGGWNEWWPIPVLVLLVANRMWAMRLGPRDLEASFRGVTGSVILYLAIVIASVLLPLPFPASAFTADQLAATIPAWCVNRRGWAPVPWDLAWCAGPHRALAAGAAYFLLSSALDLAALRRALRPSPG